MDYSKYANSQYNYPQYPYAQQHHQQQQQQQQRPQYQQQRQQQQYHPQSHSQASLNPHYPAQYQQQQQQYHQQQSQYQQTPPQIRNPFAAPAPPQSTYASHNASFDPEYEAQVAQWQSAYAPQEPAEKIGKNGKPEATAASGAVAGGVAGPARPGVTTTENPAGIAGITAGPTLPAAEEEVGPNGKKKTVVRKGGGQTWEDSTLLGWDPTQFRIMVGNLAGEVTDDSLAKAFAQYGVSKARVVRDKRTTKSRGYGFVSFTDGEMGFKAAREMTGKYIGSHPVTIQRSKTDLRPVMQKDRHNKGKFSRNNNNNNKNNDNKSQKKQDDPLKAHTGAHIEKKPVRNINGMKMLG